MTSYDALESGTPVPPVHADDLRRVFRLVQETTRGGTKPGIGIAEPLIAQHCKPGANVFAVFVRVALLQVLLRQGLLEPWCVGDEPADVVFEAMAGSRLDQGVRGFDPDAFIKGLKAQ